MRFRVENWNNFAFGAPRNPNDSFLLWRMKTHTDFHFGDNFRVFLEGKSALAADRTLPGGRRTVDVDSVALQQAFFDVRIPVSGDVSLTIRPGRQELLMGKQRLISPLPWSNSLRTWDGVTSDLAFADWHVNGFWTQFAPVSKYGFNRSDSGDRLFGIYGSGKVAGFELDLYWLGIARDAATFNGTSGAEERHLFGGRLSGDLPGIHADFELEGGRQTGSVGAGHVNAFFFAGLLGRRLPDVPWKPRLYLGFDYASGDGEAGGDVGTFNQLFPLGHAYFGFIDLVGRQNIIDFSQGAAVHPHRQLTFKIDSHFFWRASTADALYNSAGNVVRAGASGSSRQIGNEIDVTATYDFDRHFMVLLGYSHLYSGDFIEESGSADDINFSYLMFQYTF